MDPQKEKTMPINYIPDVMMAPTTAVVVGPYLASPSAYVGPIVPNEQPIPDKEHLVSDHVVSIQNDSFFDFSEASVRHAFVRKVFGLVLCQLLITSAFVTWFMLDTVTNDYVMRNIWVLYVSLSVYLGTSLLIVFSGEARRRSPYNMMFLASFTASASVMVAMVTSQVDHVTVLTALGITILIVVGLTLFACQTKWDFTTATGTIFVLCMVLFAFGLVSIITRSVQLYYAYCAAGVFIFSIFLVYDIQLILGGNHKYTISPEEYVFAALCIYLDIINIFLKVLMLLRR